MTLSQLKQFGVIPVVKIENEEDALPLADALIEGGLPTAEITFRTECAESVIITLSKSRSNMIIGAGTILNIEQAKRAVKAGAAFIVSPGFNEKVVEWCQINNILCIPGCVTPTELTAAVNMGIKVVKFFPSEAFGGLTTLKSLSAPFGDVQFMPTGGISEDNLAEYLYFKKVICCGGSFMIKDSFIKNKEFAKITELTKKACEIVSSVRNK